MVEAMIAMPYKTPGSTYLESVQFIDSNISKAENTEYNSWNFASLAPHGVSAGDESVRERSWGSNAEPVRTSKEERFFRISEMIEVCESRSGTKYVSLRPQSRQPCHQLPPRLWHQRALQQPLWCNSISLNSALEHPLLGPVSDDVSIYYLHGLDSKINNLP